MTRDRPCTNDREQRARLAYRLAYRQGYACYFCGGWVRVYEMYGGKPPSEAALVVFERGLHAGEYRRVVGCLECVLKRATLIEATVPIEELHDRSGAKPRTRAA